LENNALKIHEDDNVVIATQDVKKGEKVILNGETLCEAIADVEAGHKIALVSLASGEIVYRYGEPIVETTRSVEPGEWVHVHNTQPIPGDLKE
jgi:altronate hydrolase